MSCDVILSYHMSNLYVGGGDGGEELNLMMRESFYLYHKKPRTESSSCDVIFLLM